MGRGVTYRPQLEINSDSTVTSSTSTSSSTLKMVDNSMASPSAMLRNQSQQQQQQHPSTSHYIMNASKPIKTDANIWYPYDHLETPKISTNIGYTGSMFDRTRKSPAISPSCRYYPSSSTIATASAIDKMDPYASTSIGLESISSQQHRLPSTSSQLQSATTTSTSTPYTSLSDAYIGSQHHHPHSHSHAQHVHHSAHNLLHTSASSSSSSYHHQPSVGHSLHSPVNNYSLPYDTTAAARCALPSPTIFPPTPPPSAPWNPWAGF